MYKDQLIKAMTYIAEKPRSRFIGQQIIFKGNPMSGTLDNVDKSKMIEVPVFEETQMGMSLGLAASGFDVVTFYPRWDFLICATNQLVNHVDKWKVMTGTDVNLIIRAGKGADTPLDPGHQHKGNYLLEFKSLCPNISFHSLVNGVDIFNTYKQASDNGGIHVIVEYPELYNL